MSAAGKDARRRAQAFKAHCLDVLADQVRTWEPLEYMYDEAVSDSEQHAVFTELADQLYRWAVRITP